ncbi:hypothetical protein BBJ28_00023146 [Nothophytophthora sp. Chile5]|nr:hypothetical protein BBJ28_00023146 [Nothophytophthora sp. Chile5]
MEVSETPLLLRRKEADSLGGFHPICGVVEALVLHAQGLEKISWSDARNGNSSNKACHQRVNNFLQQRMEICDDFESYTPGTFVFGFSYRLHPTLPGSFHISDRHADRLSRVCAETTYQLKARLPVQGIFTADFEVEHPLLVRSVLTACPANSRNINMGKVAKVLGVGVKGRLRVVLDRAHYTAGDFIQGSVVLSVSAPIDCTEYIYPIFYKLDKALPGSFHVTGRNAGVMYRIDASLTYSVTATMRVKGSFAADLEAKRSFAVYRPPLGHPVRALEASASAEIQMLRLMSQGTCSVAASLQGDVHIAGDTLLAQTRIQNETSRDMSKLSVMLYEDLTVELVNAQKVEGATCVCRQDFPGVPAGQTLEQALHLPLMTKATPVRPITAAFQSRFLATKYRLVIKCSFRLCRSVYVEIPVVILPKVAPVTVYASATPVLPTSAAMPVAVGNVVPAAMVPVAASTRKTLQD